MQNTEFFKNGYLVKSLEENPFQHPRDYYGIGRYLSWPLDGYTDCISQQLNDEAFNKWFGFDDDRLLVVPSITYIKRYIKHCKELKIQTICFWIESNNHFLLSEETAPNAENMGYDYAEAGLQLSAIADDIFFPNINSRFYTTMTSFRKKLNKYGLFSSLDDLDSYANERKKMFEALGEQDEALYIIKMSKIIGNI